MACPLALRALAIEKLHSDATTSEAKLANLQLVLHLHDLVRTWSLLGLIDETGCQ